jgi:osmotically-inducible protein OsmY
MLRAFVALGVTAFAVALAGDAQAQAADQKRSLKAMEVFYKEPGMCDVEIQAMRTTLMITGTVPTEDHKKKADELGSKVRGVKDVRNRLNVREPEVAGGAVACDKIMERIDKKISEDEDLSQARRRMEITCEGTGDVKITGRVQDYTVARGLISDVRRIKGCNTIDFADLKY